MIEIDEEQRKRLVAAIEQIVPLSDAVRQAFLSVSRRIFVPTYYRREGGGLDWTLVDGADAASTDQALMTRIDPVSKHPASSSSQPSLMAMQLEALDLRPGQRVLEIGAGTGYNAALIATAEGRRWVALCAAVVDELCSRTAFPSPAWINRQEYILDQPWFYPSNPVHRDWLLATTPETFRRRNIFIGGSVLDNKAEVS